MLIVIIIACVEGFPCIGSGGSSGERRGGEQ
jgi:hypothetical protein